MRPTPGMEEMRTELQKLRDSQREHDDLEPEEENSDPGATWGPYRLDADGWYRLFAETISEPPKRNHERE